MPHETLNKIMRPGFVYIMTNTRNGTLYIGVTNDIIRRTHEHREGTIDGFTRKYGLKRLVWYETHPDVPTAIRREKALKAWQRDWKLRLIEEANPDWNDLWPGLFGDGLNAADWLAANFPNDAG